MSKLDDHFTDAERKIMDSQPIPQKAIDALPKGYTILGWGGEFEFGEKYNPRGIQYWDCHFGVWFEDEDEASPNDSPGFIFAAPTDSEIVERNATRDKLPVSGQKDPSICFKNTKPSALPTDDAERAKCIVGTYNTKYFPNALVAKARHSYANNMKHNGVDGGSARWAKDKSVGSLDRIQRHHIDFQDSLDRGDLEEALYHLSAAAWRSDELLERFITRIEPFDNL